ncbi:unnamed protein product [Allacma fusca]|uniref:Sensory neuron membrane protein 2 n=2 Tax=Allacma fusca TaxID=39272 RepID=A0A8J2JXR2_9HEXA|nr:unnamed protein product [Allacma fusca]
MQKVPAILVGLGLGLLILTIVMGWVVIPGVIKGKISEKVRLVNGTQTWERWSDITTPIFMNIYIFNTTNPDEVSEGGKPVLEEFGPYVYEEKRVKIDIELNEANNTVSYRQPIKYFFRPDLSNGTEEDEFIVINMPLVVLATRAASLGFFEQIFLSGVIEQHHEDEKLFSKVTAGQLTYHGRYVPMMKTLEEATGKAPLRNFTFGVFFPKNGSDEGVLEVNTGVEDSADFGRVVSWKGQTSLDFWKGDTCNMINGTDGSLFPPFVERDRIVRLFSADLCRSLYLKYTNDYEYKGLTGYQFSAPREMLEGALDNLNNACFCVTPGNNYTGCLKTGAIQLSACRNGAPIIMSTPHFFDGDEEYVNMSIGLKPDRERHLTYITLEPNTGLMIKAHKRIQVNVYLEPNTVSEHFTNVPTMIYPVLWADEGAVMSETTREAITKMVLKPMNIVEIGKWVLLGLSCTLIAAGLIVYMVQSSKHEYKAARTSEK